jgi:hypothetical protein
MESYIVKKMVLNHTSHLSKRSTNYAGELRSFLSDIGINSKALYQAAFLPISE